jgi:hypothetical protein
MSFPRKLTNGVKSPSLMPIERENYNDGNSAPNRMQIHFFASLLMVTLSPVRAKAQFFSFQLVFINCLDRCLRFSRQNERVMPLLP